MSALSLKGVRKQRGHGRRAVAVLGGCDLELGDGEIALLEGPSGSGKTTLLTIAAGLLSADEGQVVLAGTDLGTLSPVGRRAHRARNVGFVFQRANLLEGLSAIENVLLAADLADTPADEARARCDALFVALGIDGLQDRRPHELSGGEEHRVAIARAIVHRPRIVLADEPTGNLDGATGAAVMQTFRELVAQAGVALLIATHDARLRALPARVLTLADGQLTERERP